MPEAIAMMFLSAPAKLHADHVVVGVHAKAGAREGALRDLDDLRVVARDHGGGRHAPQDLGRDVGAAQDPQLPDRRLLAHDPRDGSCPSRARGPWSHARRPGRARTTAPSSRITCRARARGNRPRARGARPRTAAPRSAVGTMVVGERDRRPCSGGSSGAPGSRARVSRVAHPEAARGLPPARQGAPAWCPSFRRRARPLDRRVALTGGCPSVRAARERVRVQAVAGETVAVVVDERRVRRHESGRPGARAARGG